MTEKKQTKMELLIQFIKFGIVGVTNTVVSYVINVATLFLLGHAHIFQRWDYIIANTVAFILSVLWSFYWNNKLVFNMEGTSWKELFAGTDQDVSVLRIHRNYSEQRAVISVDRCTPYLQIHCPADQLDHRRADQLCTQ